MSPGVRPLVLISDSAYPDDALERAELAVSGARVVRARCRTEEELIVAARDAVALIVQYAPVTERVFAALPSLRVVSRYGAGYDNVDVEAAARHGVWVSNTPVYGTDEVAVHAFALILAVCRGLAPLDRSVRTGRWDHRAAGPLAHPSTLTLGVLGLGRIGRRVAELGSAVFGRVIGHDPQQPGDVGGVPNLPLGELLSGANVLSVHVPLTPLTRGMVDADALAALRVPRMLVNTSRGEVVDSAAVAAALESGLLSGAALDVLSQEPPDAEEPLLAAERLLLTPHAAWFTTDSEDDVRRRAAANVREFLATGRPLTPVNRPVAERGGAL